MEISHLTEKIGRREVVNREIIPNCPVSHNRNYNSAQIKKKLIQNKVPIHCADSAQKGLC